MMRCTLLLLSINLCSTTFAQDKWDLQRCVGHALQYNISIRQADVQARLAAMQYKQNTLQAYPAVDFSSNIGVNFGRSIDPTTNQFTTSQTLFNSFSVQANVPIYQFNKIKNTVQASQFNAQAALAEVDKAKSDVVLNVAGAYLQVLVAQEQVKIADVQIQQTKEQLKVTQKKIAAGALPDLNAAQLEAQLASDSASYINAKMTVNQNLLQLKAIINLDAGYIFEIATPSVESIPTESLADLEPESVYALAIKSLPHEMVNALKVKSAEKSFWAVKTAFYPSIQAFGGLGTNFANPFQKIMSSNFLGTYQNTPFVTNVMGTNYPVLSPQFDFKHSTKSFGEVWKGYGNQLEQNFRQNVGISITVPIFNNGTAKMQLEQARLNYQTLVLQKEQAEQKFKQDIYLAYTQAIGSFQKFSASQKTVKAAQKAYLYASKRYNLGLISTIELITTQGNLFKASIELLSAQYDYVFRLKILEFYKGQGIKL